METVPYYIRCNITANFPVTVRNNRLSFYFSYGYVIFSVDADSLRLFQNYYLDLPGKLSKSLVKDNLSSLYFLKEW